MNKRTGKGANKRLVMADNEFQAAKHRYEIRAAQERRYNEQPPRPVKRERKDLNG